MKQIFIEEQEKIRNSQHNKTIESYIQFLFEQIQQKDVQHREMMVYR